MCAVCDEHVIPMMWVWSVWFGARHDSIHNPGILHSSCYCEGMKDTVMAHHCPQKIATFYHWVSSDQYVGGDLPEEVQKAKL